MSKPYKYIDLTYLNDITDGNKEMIDELINIFIEQIPEFTEGFKEGFSNKDWNKIAAVAHKAKSSVISMGMNDLGETDLKNLELISKQCRIEELKNGETEANTEEIERLTKNLESYSQEKIDWVRTNSNIEKIKELIEKFNFACTQSQKELNSVLEN